MIRFLIVLLVFGVCVGIGGFITERLYSVDLPSFFFQTLILLIASTGILYRYLYRTSREHFVQLYLLTIVVKIFAYGAYMFVIALKDKPGAFQNVVFFMVLYVALTALEIGFLYRKKTHL